MLPAGRTFYKMSGSGNDFVVVDATREAAGELTAPATVRAICARAIGIGADGLVLLESSRRAEYRMTLLKSKHNHRTDGCEGESQRWIVQTNIGEFCHAISEQMNEANTKHDPRCKCACNSEGI